MDSTFKERLNAALAWSGITTAELAARHGIPLAEVESWRQMDTADLSGTHAAWCGIILNCSIIWLTTGIGSPEPLGKANTRKARLGEKLTLRGRRKDRAVAAPS